MVVDDLYVFGAVIPAKTDSILIIDSNAELAFSVTFEPFQPIAWWTSQIVQFVGSRKNFQLPASSVFDLCELPNSIAAEQFLRFLAAKRLDH